MSDDATPEEFENPEGDGEQQDPDLVLESPVLRAQWSNWMCRSGSGTFSDIEFYGRRIGGVPTPAVDAYRALEQALRTTRYAADSCWAYNCRSIAGTNVKSLHSAGIAIDIDPNANPYTAGDPYSGRLQRTHVDAALAIRNTKGERIWLWGGSWSKPDRMHFQLNRGPTAVQVNWSTVPGGKPIVHDPKTKTATEEEETMILKKGNSSTAAIKQFQQCLRAWNSKALPRYGADGDFGNETVEWVRKFQTSFGLEATGEIEGITAALLALQTKPPKAK